MITTTINDVTTNYVRTTNAWQHCLDTNRGDAALYAENIATTMKVLQEPDLTPTERQEIANVLHELNDKFYARVDLIIELIFGF